MSFRIIAAVTRSQAGKMRDKFRKKPKRIDKDLPLGICIGGMVDFTRTPFIIAKSGGSIVDFPGESRFVQAYGRLSIDSDLTMHRFYLKGDGDFILRIITKKDRSIVEGDGLILFQQKEVFVPSSAEAWNQWMGDPDDSENPFCIGWETYGIGDTEDPLFFRTIDCDFENESPGEDQCYMVEAQLEPLSFTEKVYSESSGSGTRVSRKMMIYARDLENEGGADVEHCTVSSVECSEEGYIEVLVGIPLSTGNISVI